jgi:hypothetical protein
VGPLNRRKPSNPRAMFGMGEDVSTYPPEIQAEYAKGPQMCARCGLKLNLCVRWEGDEASTEWLHYRETDHAPEPVDETAEAVGLAVCDFCSEPDPEWVLGCLPFPTLTLVGDIPISQQDRGTGSWAACQRCKDLLDAGRVEDVIAIAVNVIRVQVNREHTGANRKLAMKFAVANIAERHHAFCRFRTGRDVRRPYINGPEGRIYVQLPEEP